MKLTASETIEIGMRWIRENREAYIEMREAVAREAARIPYGELRIGSFVESLRDRGVSVPNAAKPYLARRIEREVEGAKFTKSRSKIDLLMQDE